MRTYKQKFLSSVAWLAVASFGFGFMAHAATVSCATTHTLSTINTDSGCYDTDKLFSTFAVSSSSGGSANFPSATTDVNLLASGGGYTGGTPPTGIDDIALTFTPTNGTSWSLSSSHTYTTTISYLAAVDSNTSSDPSYQAPATGSWVVDTLTLPSASYNFNGSTSSGDKILITESFCVGQATVTAGCNGGSIVETIQDGTTVTVSYTFTANTASPGIGTFNTSTGELTFAQAFLSTEVAIQDIVSVTRAASTVTLNSFENQFGEEVATPEPSTFILLGSALLALGMLRRKRS